MIELDDTGMPVGVRPHEWLPCDYLQYAHTRVGCMLLQYVRFTSDFGPIPKGKRYTNVLLDFNLGTCSCWNAGGSHMALTFPLRLQGAASEPKCRECYRDAYAHTRGVKVCDGFQPAPTGDWK